MNEEIKGNENNSSVTDQAEQGQTFTEADVERRVTQAVKTTEARMEKLFNERLKSTVQEQLSEAQKMQSMDERDRELYTIQKENEELRAKQSEYIKAQNLNSATQVLTNRNLPPALAKYLISFVSSAAVMLFRLYRKKMAADCETKLPDRRKGNDINKTIVDSFHY